MGNPRMKRISGLVSTMLVLCPGASHGQEPACDPRLVASADGELAYKSRGNRCEGRYANAVGASVGLVGFYEYMQPLRHDLPKTLLIQWTALPQSTVHLRAEAFRPVYYRMDTTVSDNGSFEWPTDIIAKCNVARYLAVRGWVEVDGGRRYLPLRVGAKPVGSQATTPRPPSYTAIIWPTLELQEVYVSVHEVLADGKTGEIFRNSKPLKYGNYPKNQPVMFPIQRATELSGWMRVHISAVLRQGGRTQEEFEFFQAAPDPVSPARPEGSGD